MNSFDFCAAENNYKKNWRTGSTFHVTGSVAKPSNNKCPSKKSREGELGTACYMYSAGTVSAGLFPLLYNSC